MVSIYPEGHSGLFRNRHIIDTFFPGVVRLALRYRVPIVPTAMIGFREASPILKDIHRDYDPNDPAIVLPPLPLKLKVEFGEPFELSNFYGLELTKAEEFWIVNEVVRPRMTALMKNHKPARMSDIQVEMSQPVLSKSS